MKTLRLTPWQFVALTAIIILGAQLPMFVLAASIDNDEAAKSALGWIVSAVFTGLILIIAKIWLGFKGKSESMFPKEDD